MSVSSAASRIGLGTDRTDGQTDRQTDARARLFERPGARVAMVFFTFRDVFFPIASREDAFRVFRTPCE